MKKIMAVILSAIMVMSLAACNKLTGTVVNPDPEPETTGGWSVPESGEITEEHIALLEKAMGNSVGATYELIEFLGTQVVAGTNYKFLAKETMVTNPPTEKEVYIVIYEDLDKNASITSVEDVPAGPEIPQITGGWNEPESGEITEEHIALLEKAMGNNVGATYELVEFLGTQVVAGMNYKFLAKETMVTNPPTEKNVYIVIYLDLIGNASITSVEDAPDGNVGAIYG